MSRALAPVTMAALLMAAALPGCLSGYPDDGWTFVDRQRSCSECEDAHRTKGLEVERTFTVIDGHDVLAMYFEEHPEPGKFRLTWASSFAGAVAEIQLIGGPLACPLGGGNATDHEGPGWRASLRPGDLSCEVDLEFIVDLDEPASFIQWQMPPWRDGHHGPPFEFTFTARRLA